MSIAYFSSPLGIAKIEGDGNGVSTIFILSEGEASKKIPKELKNAVNQLQEYFEGKRKDFDFKLNPK